MFYKTIEDLTQEIDSYKDTAGVNQQARDDYEEL